MSVPTKSNHFEESVTADLDQPSEVEEWRQLESLAKDTLKQFEHSGNVSDLNTTVFLCREALELLPATHPDRPSVLIRLAKAYGTRYMQTGQSVDLDEANSLNREALELLPAAHPIRWKPLTNLAVGYIVRFQQTGQSVDLDEAIKLNREAFEVQDLSDSDRTPTLTNLAGNFLVRFKRRGQMADLEESIKLYRDVVAVRRDRPGYLQNLAGCLYTRFHESSQVTDLEEAINLLKEALQLQPAPHPHRWTSLNTLANNLRARFSLTGQITDLDEPIKLLREALDLQSTSHPGRLSSLNNLAITLRCRFDQTGQTADLDEAIKLHSETLTLRSVSHPERPSTLNDLANSFRSRFGQTGHIADLDEAVKLQREGLMLQSASDPLRPSLLSDLGNSLHTRFGQTSQIADLDEAIKVHREALILRLPSHRNRSTTLRNLAHTLHTQVIRTGDIMVLDEAVKLLREALKLRPAPHSDRPLSLNDLAFTLHTRFDQTGQVVDLDEAIKLLREAIGLRSVSHPHRPTSLNNLANTLRTRFDLTSQFVDLDEALKLIREALALLPPSHPHRWQSLNNLAITYRRRFAETGQIVDLDETIKLHREALGLVSASHADRPMSLNNLANSLAARSGLTSQIVDLDEAINLQQDAIDLLDESHPYQAILLNNLSTSLRKRFLQTDQLADLDAAIELLGAALQRLPESHPNRLPFHSNLATYQLARFQRVDDPPGSEDILSPPSQSVKTLPQENLGMQGSELTDNIMTNFRAAANCDSAPSLGRFHAAQHWASHADSTHESALEAYQTAIELLPRLVMLGLDLQSRQKALSGSDGLARNAASCAIRSGEIKRAVELLEAGRGIFWSQALQLRTPLDELKLKDADLARKLEGLGHALEKGSSRDTFRTEFDSMQKAISIEGETVHFRRLNEEWLATLEEIRRLDGFEDFLRPRNSTTLQKAAARGPVVILNASKSDCAALVMTSLDVQLVPLPDFSIMDAEALVQVIRTLPGPSSRGDRAWRRASPRPPDEIFHDVLAMLWKSVVFPVIRALNLQKSDVPPRLWWCPTGPFAFLPIHAAGIYNLAVGKTESVPDYVVSSYTPTLSALLAAPPSVAKQFEMVAVIQPEAPGFSSLPSTREELHKIEGRVPRQFLTRLGIPEAPASVEQVLSNLSNASIVHFACHGVQNPHNPLESAVILEDGRLKVSRIMEEPMPNASLAFLSACQTAAGDERLPDEAMHLAATLLFAGFRGTVATMWSIHDDDGPKVADTFYAHLFAGELPSTLTPAPPDTTEAARALHIAIARLRAEKCSFSRWVPFIHLGL